MKRLFALISVIRLLIFNTVSCSQKAEPSCRELIVALTDSEIALPAGKIYSMSAPEGDDEYLSISLLSSLYGNGSEPALLDCWLDCAVFLSRGEHPCEFAVFLCDSHNSATDTARLLCNRLDLIRHAKSSENYCDMLEGATVTVSENFVALIVSGDTPRAVAVLRAKMR